MNRFIPIIIGGISGGILGIVALRITAEILFP